VYKLKEYLIVKYSVIVQLTFASNLSNFSLRVYVSEYNYVHIQQV